MTKSVNARIAKSTLVVAFWTLLTRPVSLLKEILVAAKLGTGTELDAFVISVLLPALLGGILASAIRASVVPVLSEFRVRGDRAGAERTLFSVMNVSMLAMVALSLLLIVLRKQFVPILAPGFDQVTAARAMDLVLYSCPTLIFLCVNSLLSSVLNTHEGFVSPIVADSLIPLATALVVMLGFGRWGVASLAIGNLLGTVVSSCFLAIAARRMGFRYRMGIDWRDPMVQKTWRLFAPLLLASTLASLNTLFDRTMASTLPAGSVSTLEYAQKLNSSIQGILLISLSTAVLPYFSQQVASADFEGLKAALRTSLRLLALLLLPITALIVVLSKPIVVLLFERGSFGPTSSALVSRAFMFYGLGLCVVAAGYMFPRAFNALGQNAVLVKVGIPTVALNVGLNFALMKSLGSPGIALSTTLTSLAASTVQFLLLRKRLGPLGMGESVGFFSKLLLITGVSAMAGFLILRAAPSDPLLCVPIVGGAVIAVWLVGGWLLMRKEVKQMWRTISRDG